MAAHYNNSEIDKAKRRMKYLVPNFLVPYLQGRNTVCSVGCGMGFDVDALYCAGFDAYGFDPGNRTEVWSGDATHQAERLKVGFAHDYPLGRGKFDAVYSLEVLEHVGCEGGGTRLQPDWEKQRREFIQACLEMTRPGGVVMVASLNRLFPADTKHKHRYSWLYRATGCLVNPLNRKNFLPSVSDIRRWLAEIDSKKKWTIRRLATATYPSGAAQNGKTWKTKLTRFVLRLLDLPGVRIFNPILLVEIKPRTTT